MFDYGYPDKDLVRLVDGEPKFAHVESAVESDWLGITNGPAYERTAVLVQIKNQDGTLAEKIFRQDVFRELMSLYGIHDLACTYTMPVIAVYNKRTGELENLLPLRPNSTLQTQRQRRLEERLPS